MVKMIDQHSKLPLAKDISVDRFTTQVAEMFSGTSNVLKPSVQRISSKEALASLKKAVKQGAFNNDQDLGR